MLLALKILLVIVSYVFIFFTEKHMWARILSVLTSISWIAWTIIPHISSEIPKKSDLWQSFLFVLIFICIYFAICGSIHAFREESMHNKGKGFDSKPFWYVSLTGTIISFFLGCVIGIYYEGIYSSNIEKEYKYENTVVSSVNLIATDTSAELLGKLDGTANSNIMLFVSSTQTTINGSLATVQKINYWYYESDGSINPGSVPKESIKIFFIEDDETPHMDTIVRTAQLIEHNYNKMIKTTYEKQEVNRAYVFYVPKGSILEEFNFNE